MRTQLVDGLFADLLQVTCVLGITILKNITDNCERCGQKNIVQSCFHQHCNKLSIFFCVQVLRSVGEWSAGCQPESSIYNAYIHLIKTSKHYIYIEVTNRKQFYDLKFVFHFNRIVAKRSVFHCVHRPFLQ